MTPTIFSVPGYRFIFSTGQETRKHVHVYCIEGQAKVWLEPRVEMAENYRLSRLQVKQIEEIVEVNQNELKNWWIKHYEKKPSFLKTF